MSNDQLHTPAKDNLCAFNCVLPSFSLVKCFSIQACDSSAIVTWAHQHHLEPTLEGPPSIRQLALQFGTPFLHLIQASTTFRTPVDSINLWTKLGHHAAHLHAISSPSHTTVTTEACFAS